MLNAANIYLLGFLLTKCKYIYKSFPTGASVTKFVLTQKLSGNTVVINPIAITKISATWKTL